MDKENAIQVSCVHVDDSGLCIEGVFPESVVETVTLHCPGLKGWPGWALFFVWTHLVIVLHADLSVFGDSRRGGAYI